MSILDEFFGNPLKQAQKARGISGAPASPVQPQVPPPVPGSGEDAVAIPQARALKSATRLIGLVILCLLVFGTVVVVAFTIIGERLWQGE